jgi:hydrogenase expression/formation protein HypE
LQGFLKLEHGGGGSLTRELLEEVIVPSYFLNHINNGIGLPEMDDGATIPLGNKNIVVTTDATTVKPLFFPGGDLGRLAICGAINDLSMMGARPIALASALVVEEGFPISTFRQLLISMNNVMVEVGVPLIAGDTKVVEKGSLDEIVASTTGIGLAENVVTDSGSEPCDKVIVTGTIGNHQLALLSKREGLSFETSLESDVAPLWGMIEKTLEIGGIKAMKDPTRGGLSGALNELARKGSLDIVLKEEAIPVKGVVRSATEMLGLDPMELANEGIAVMVVDAERAEDVLKVLRETELGRDAAIVGEVKEGPHRVILETEIGGRRIVREPYGSPMPRICGKNEGR